MCKSENLAQAKKIEAKLAEVEAEVVEARAKVERTKVTADNTIAVFLKDAEAVLAELREDSNREKRSNDIAKFQSLGRLLKRSTPVVSTLLKK